MQIVPEPILCRSCYAQTVPERGVTCHSCAMKDANRAELENDLTRRRILIIGLVLGGISLSVFVAAIVRSLL